MQRIWWFLTGIKTERPLKSSIDLTPTLSKGAGTGIGGFII
jgi:hypothetical protein